MTQKIKVGAVSYLNTKPLVYGFEQGMMEEAIDLSFDYPANVARQLMNNEIDLGLVPVAVLPMLPEYYIISDYCIGADGAVASVCLFSDVPLSAITEVLMDYQSRTSAALLKILLQQHWNITPKLTSAEKGFETNIKDTIAGLVIGDRAFSQRKKSKYIYDLAEAWKQMTGLPFVFAVWAANKKLDVAFKTAFNNAIANGVNNMALVLEKETCSEYNLKTYYTENIKYLLDEPKKKGLNTFLNLLNSILQTQKA